MEYNSHISVWASSGLVALLFGIAKDQPVKKYHLIWLDDCSWLKTAVLTGMATKKLSSPLYCVVLSAQLWIDSPVLRLLLICICGAIQLSF